MQATEVFQEIRSHDLSVELYEWDEEKVHSIPIKTMDSLESTLRAAVRSAQAELQVAQQEYTALPPTQRKHLAADGELPRASKCRWFHMSGCS